MAAHELQAIQTLLISDRLFRTNDVAKVGLSMLSCLQRHAAQVHEHKVPKKRDRNVSGPAVLFRLSAKPVHHAHLRCVYCKACRANAVSFCHAAHTGVCCIAQLYILWEWCRVRHLQTYLVTVSSIFLGTLATRLWLAILTCLASTQSFDRWCLGTCSCWMRS